MAMVSTRKKWLETATGSDLLFGLESPPKEPSSSTDLVLGHSDGLFERQSRREIIAQRRTALQRVQLQQTKPLDKFAPDTEFPSISTDGSSRKFCEDDDEVAPVDMDDVELEQQQIYQSFSTEWHLPKLIQKMDQRLKCPPSPSSSTQFSGVTAVMNVFKSHSVDSHDSDSSSRSSLLMLDAPAGASSQDNMTSADMSGGNFLSSSITKFRSSYTNLISSSFQRQNINANNSIGGASVGRDEDIGGDSVIYDQYTNVARPSRWTPAPNERPLMLQTEGNDDNDDGTGILEGVSWDSEDDGGHDATDSALILTDTEDNASEIDLTYTTIRRNNDEASEERSATTYKSAVMLPRAADPAGLGNSRSDSSSNSSTCSEDDPARSLASCPTFSDPRRKQLDHEDEKETNNICSPIAKLLESTIKDDFSKNFKCEILGIEMKTEAGKRYQASNRGAGKAGLMSPAPPEFHMVFVVRITLPDWLPPTQSTFQPFLGSPDCFGEDIEGIESVQRLCGNGNATDDKQCRSFLELCKVVHGEWKQRSRYSRRRVFTVRKDVASLCFLHGQLSAIVQNHRLHLDAIHAMTSLSYQGDTYSHALNVLQSLSALSESITVPFFPDSFLLSSVDDQLSGAVRVSFNEVGGSSQANAHSRVSSIPDYPYVYSKYLARDFRAEHKDIYFSQEWKSGNNVFMSQVYLVMDHVDSYLKAVMLLVYNIDSYVDIMVNNRVLISKCFDVSERRGQIGGSEAFTGNVDQRGNVTQGPTQHVAAVSTMSHEVGRIWGGFISCEATANYNSMFSLSGSTDEYDEHVGNAHHHTAYRNNSHNGGSGGLNRRHRANSFEIAAQRASNCSWRRAIWHQYSTGGIRVHLLLSANQVNNQLLLQSSSIATKLLSRLTNASIDSELFRIQSGKCIGCGEKLTQASGLLNLAGTGNTMNYVHCLVTGGLLCKKWCWRRLLDRQADPGVTASSAALNEQIVPHLFIRNWDTNLYPMCGVAYTYVCDMLDVCLYSISSLNPLLYDGIPSFKVTKNIRHKLIILLDALLADKHVDVKQVILVDRLNAFVLCGCYDR
jgi:hypothetical protein